jgi:uncharacterized OsmC-like protein
MAVGGRVTEAVARARALFARRPGAARSHRAATARLTGDGWRTTVELGAHTLVMDQPVALGGDEAGPNPGDLIRAALAAYLAQNYAMHATAFEVERVGVEVVVDSDIDLRSAWGVPTDTPPGFTTVSYTTTLTTPSAPERVQALAAFAEAHSPAAMTWCAPLRPGPARHPPTGDRHRTTRPLRGQRNLGGAHDRQR